MFDGQIAQYAFESVESSDSLVLVCPEQLPANFER
jgi:hypothetical protein